MNNIIDFFIKKNKATISALLLILIMGFFSYQNISKEDIPDIKIPFINISVNHNGISPEDSESLIVKPLEKELSSINNIKSINSTAQENGANISIEFNAGIDSSIALKDVEDAVSRAKSKLPSESDDPFIKEASINDRPVLNVMLSGNISEIAKIFIAKDLADEIEKLKEVLEVDIIGEREEIIEVLISPKKIQSYQIDFNELGTMLSNNNRLVAAGNLENSKGNFSLKIPGKINDLYTLSEIPVKIVDEKIVKLKDIADFNRTYENRKSIARFNGQETIALNIKRKNGENIIDTINNVKKVISKKSDLYPSNLIIDYTNDSSKNIKNMLYDLENNILSSVLLVFIVVVAFLGIRTGLLISIAIPGSFLMGILMLSNLSFTINVIVLFGLIMSIGLLVDGAIVVTEFADKKISEGFSVKESYTMASKRMALPIISSTATTLAAFMPLLFWPGIVGDFMKYLPITLILTLSSSLIMALIFIPTLGAYFAKERKLSEIKKKNIKSIENGNFDNISGFEKAYYLLLKKSIKTPFLTFFTILFLSIIIIFGYIKSQPKIEFFPSNEAERTTIVVKQRGDFSMEEKSELIKEVENILKPHLKYIESYYTNISSRNETIATIDINFIDWSIRKKAVDIISDIRQGFDSIEGLILEIEEQSNGPSSGKPLQLDVFSDNKASLYQSIPIIERELKELGYLIDIENSLPVNGIDWEYEINRDKLSYYGVSIGVISNYIKLYTNGIKITEFIPDYTNEEVDVLIKVPFEYRKLENINDNYIKTSKGLVPITEFVTLSQSRKINSIKRINEKETVQIKANIQRGININSKIKEIESVLINVKKEYNDINFNFKGDQENQKESSEFLKNAFLISIAIMFIILLVQFNNFSQPIIVLSSIIFSSIGVLLLLSLTGISFGIVMGGIGIIALAGIVVNNNIVLIDTFNYKYFKESKPLEQSILETGVQRLKPVLLTTVTTILGLLPMALQLNIDIINGEVIYSPPSSLMWYQLSISIVGGLAFATIITLVLTPSLLYITNKKYFKIK